MQEKESIMILRCELKMASLKIIVRHHSATLVVLNSYHREGIFNPLFTTMEDSYVQMHEMLEVDSVLFGGGGGNGKQCDVSQWTGLPLGWHNFVLSKF